MKHLYASLAPCGKEEEVKAEFCKFFKMKIFALRGIDHYTERVLFEFKYDRNFIRIDYHFLKGDDADYSGIARRYRRYQLGGRVRLLLADVRIGAYSAVVQAVRYYNESRGVSNFRKLHPCVLPPNTKNGIMRGNRVNLAL